MRKWAFFVAGLLLVGLTWSWLQGARVPTGTIQSTDYDPGVTASGPVLRADLLALQSAVNHIDSSQTDAASYIEGLALLTNSVPYNKLEEKGGDSTAVNWWFGWNAISDTTLRKIVTIGAINSMNIDSLFADDAFDSSRIHAKFKEGVVQVTTATTPRMAWGKAKVRITTNTLFAGDSAWFHIDFADSSSVGDPAFGRKPIIFLFLTALPDNGSNASWMVGNAGWSINVDPNHVDADSVGGWIFCTQDSMRGIWEVNWQALERP